MSGESLSPRERMAKDLDAAIRVNGRAGKRNYVFTAGLAFAAAGASVLASILAFVKADSAVVGAIALVPAMAAIIISSLKLQEKANWYYRKRTALHGIYNKLHFETPTDPPTGAIAALSRDWTELNQAMEGDWEGKLAIAVNDLRKLHKDS